MKSFPSSLNRGNKNIIMNHASKSLLDNIVSTFKDSFSNAWKSGMNSIKFGASTSGSPVNTDGIQFDDSLDKKVLLAGLDFTKFRDYRGQKIPRGSSSIKIEPQAKVENPYNFDSAAIALMNKYRYKTLKDVTVCTSPQAKDGNAFGGGQDVKRSLFNPYNGVHILGITENVPLLYDQIEEVLGGGDSNFTIKFDNKISDCSISRLVAESAKKESILGQAKYKYADFAFCKDLGMPNNRLITLRKFSTPVGDYIFRASAVRNKTEDNSGGSGDGKRDKYTPFNTPADVGRMCCYFDTDDNKLEDILKYNFSGSWKNMEAKIDKQPSQENDHVTPVGSVLNMLNPSMNTSIANGFSGSSNHLIGRAFNSWFGWNTQAYHDNKVLTNYDEHKIYTPRNTVQSMHKYEGNLQFKHEFTLVFSYKLRGYQNINPKSAMLDLLANIFATTYFRGSFWGGRNEIIGAQPNKSGWNKANQLIDKFGDMADGLIASLENGTFDFSSLLGSLGNSLGQVVDYVKNALSNPIDTLKEGAQAVGKVIKDNKIPAAVKGLVKNQLGRPEIYAFQSLLDGSNTGLWHVTIGNPFNPIAVMGNLIITDVQVQHLGPLGIDDFPTELKVTVSLKHSRPRDAVAMERMYTKGVGAIYMPLTGYKEYTEVFQDEVKEEIGSLDYYGEFEPDRIKRNAEELA